MSYQKELLQEIGAALSSQGERRISEWFTEDFRLHDPTAPEWPTGLRGAAEMLEKTTSGGPSTKLEATFDGGGGRSRRGSMAAFGNARRRGFRLCDDGHVSLRGWAHRGGLGRSGSGGLAVAAALATLPSNGDGLVSYHFARGRSTNPHAYPSALTLTAIPGRVFSRVDVAKIERSICMYLEHAGTGRPWERAARS